MASEDESFLVLVHYSEKIQRSKKYGLKFTDREPFSIFISSSSTLSDPKNIILSKLRVFGSKWVKKLFYKISIIIVSTSIKYDIRVLFHCLRSFSEVRIHEFYLKLEVGVDSYGASAPVSHSTAMGGDLDHTEAVGSVPFENHGVRHQTYEVDNGPGIIPDVLRFGEPDRVENAISDGNSDQESVDIIGDIDDDTGANLHTQYGPSSFGTQQYPLHFSTLNLEGTWEVRRYNGLHTCLATSISSDHRQLDYHALTARIYPLVRTDAVVMIKVLQEATEANYRFRPSYRKVWMAKQKAIAQIYRDWEESYAELPCWMLGVQSTMADTVTVLKTSPEGILVISNRHNGIKTALEAPDGGWLPLRAFRAFCIRHVAANFSLSFNGQDVRRMLVNATYAKTEAEFDYLFDIMRTENPAMCDWVNRMEYDKWTRCPCLCPQSKISEDLCPNIPEQLGATPNIKGAMSYPCV
ncbi:uncharacterized protein LOC107466174 [Arachis duranensis]|uniref:Uncharacterized protein LOC107466174 n=1 Tax=Arachis duranensis TaxID=130453 RepID=A0A6P4C635_ARADU|nr:uncharacterized protein LOC107466174 [Arachis duranensis]